VRRGIRGNGKGATATVTWCGCRRGESFEGCENRRGEGVGTPDGHWIRPGAGWEPDSTKRDEPQDWQRDATSPRPPSGGNRRGGAKPRGRNGISRVVPSEPKHEPQGACGSRRSVACRWRGGSGTRSNPARPLANPKRGGRFIRPGRRVSTLKGSQGPRVRSIPRSFGNARIGGAQSEDLEDPPGNR